MIPFKKVSVLIFCCSLWACVEGENKDETTAGGTGSGINTNTNTTGGASVKTGAFIYSAVKGLHFRTATQSGLTNASSEFNYLEGETITFSVGGVIIGSASGAFRITPFDLFNLAIVQTESAIVETLTNKGITDYDRLVNLMVFLTSLDNDGNPENGLDLIGWHAKLSSASLSFDYNKNDFLEKSFDRFSRKYGVNNKKTLAIAFAHLLNSVYVNISPKLLTKTEEDADLDGTFDNVNVYEYDTKGRRTMHKTDTGKNGNFEYIEKKTYNADGSLSQSQYLRDTDGRYSLDATHIVTNDYTYDANGNVTSYVQNTDSDGDADGDRKPDSRFEQLSVYDANNKLTSVLDKHGSVTTLGSFVLNKREITQYTYDSKGRKLTYKKTIDNNANYVGDSIDRTSYTYNASGRLVEEIGTSDTNADGTADSTLKTTYSYDANNNILTFLKETDNVSSNSGFDEIESLVNTYDAKGNKLTETTLYYFYTPNSNVPYKKTVKTNTYNSLNQPLYSFIKKDNDNNGTFDTAQSNTYTYDTAGNLISHTWERYTDATASSINYQIKYTNTYDSNNNRLSQIVKTDSNGDGALNYETRETKTYDGRRLLSKLSTVDNNGDGNRNTGSNTTYTYEAKPDALIGLILQNIAQ